MTGTRETQADALLGALQRERGGQLKVFLGAAPGVGKTYAMLSRAAELKRQGIDVVVGVVETHGRRETAALLEGLEVLPRKPVEHRGHRLAEFDSRDARTQAADRADRRARPSQCTRSRHERRWQDVGELSTWARRLHTINIQHLESLNDVVHRSPRARQRNRADSVFDRLATSCWSICRPAN